MGAFRVLSGVVVGVAVVVGLVGCEPGAGLSTGAVAFTTDQTATRELEKQGLDVKWLTCTASYDDKADSKADDKSGDEQTGNQASPSAHTVANVDCTGEDEKGREIKVTGKVTKEVSGKCVRGDLTAKVDGKQWFRVDVLGNCDAPDATPTPHSPVTDQPDQPGPTVTVTQTIWCQRDPECWPEGK